MACRDISKLYNSVRYLNITRTEQSLKSMARTLGGR
jgi:hypothetical protein